VVPDLYGGTTATTEAEAERPARATIDNPEALAEGVDRLPWIRPESLNVVHDLRK
jgi:hypothetical protein